MQKPEENENIKTENSHPPVGQKPSKQRLYWAAKAETSELNESQAPTNHSTLKPSRWQLFHAVKKVVELPKQTPPPPGD